MKQALILSSGCAVYGTSSRALETVHNEVAEMPEHFSKPNGKTFKRSIEKEFARKKPNIWNTFSLHS